MKIKTFFIELLSTLSPNIIDWIRSIYFSLFGSSMLALVLKCSTYDKKSLIFFSLGVFCFLLGLGISLSIANRFKNYEKKYDNRDDDFKKGKKFLDYYLEKETDRKKSTFLNNIKHLLFFVIWLPALYFILIAGFSIEKKSSNSSSIIETKINHIDSILKVKDSSSKLYIENKKLTKTNEEIKKKYDSIIMKLKQSKP